jgi:REP element-mobilizing transposase RayT
VDCEGGESGTRMRMSIAGSLSSASERGIFEARTEVWNFSSRVLWERKYLTNVLQGIVYESLKFNLVKYKHLEVYYKFC